MLPQELWDLIIGHLDGDIPSLKSCALTSTAFRPSSQKGIFSRVYVSSISPSSFHGHTFENLYALLSSSPHIPPLITSFELSLHHQSEESEFEKILLFLPFLRNVHRFFLLSATNLVFEWINLPVRVQESLVAFWRALNIIDLQIEAMGRMALDEGSRLRMGGWSSLKHLSILWSSPEGLWESNDQGSLPSPQLESLTVGYFNLDLIKYAGLDISFDLLARFQVTLEYLHLEMTLHMTAIEFQTRYNYFDLYQCRNLRVVHIGIDTLQDLFPFARMSPSVEEISIEILRLGSRIYPRCSWSNYTSTFPRIHIVALPSANAKMMAVLMVSGKRLQGICLFCIAKES
ncbi:hypothetical protein IW262DRAFT_990452 [Armillaria fumosa]|nr:hypothetical protein IW262DRAFT_990452 [Armillaria fumosa]